MDLWLIIVLSIIAFLLVAFLTFCLLLGRKFFRITFLRRKGDKDFAKNENPKFKNEPDRVWFMNHQKDELSIISKDNLRLNGYYLNNNSNKLAILVHGYKGRYYSLCIQGRFFYEAGFDVLAINNRSHDESEGKSFTMGVKEKEDLLIWINHMLKINPDYEIVLYGVSMGGHIVMMTSSLKELPNNVKCTVEDCGYSSLDEELRYEIFVHYHLKRAGFIMFCANMYSVLFHHFLIKSNTKIALKDCQIPMMFIHGDNDDYVPYSNLKSNSEAHKQEQTVKTYKGCGHNESIKKNKEDYIASVLQFVNKYIKQ